MNTLLTNEWTDATTHKPWAGRPVLCRTSTGEMLVLKWNGMYWIDAYLNVRTQVTMQANVTHFYIFEMFYDEKD